MTDTASYLGSSSSSSSSWYTRGSVLRARNVAVSSGSNYRRASFILLQVNSERISLQLRLTDAHVAAAVAAAAAESVTSIKMTMMRAEEW